MRRLVPLFILALSQPALGQLPEFYKSVDRVIWVVKDMERVAQGWKTLGFPVMEVGEVGYGETEFRGQAVSGRMRVALANLAGAQVVWIQPLSGNSAYTEFLAQHRDGVFSLMHRVPTLCAFQNELKRLQGAGLRVLQQGVSDAGDVSVTYAFLDTVKSGKYALGLVHDPSDFSYADTEKTRVASSVVEMNQFAFLARNIHEVSVYWA